ncbi:MAG: hypothetical protein JNK04_08245 [Myxococcales bacterium]|nr:hypothetical protein [Myxococcales bacterium]
MLVSASTGCIVVDDDDDWNDDEVIIDDDPEIQTVPIDAGETLQADPGEGVGVFVEYLGGGDWNVWATCDSEFSGYSCSYDVFVNADGLIVGDDRDLEADDFIEEDLDFAHFGFETDFDTDGVEFSTFNDEPVQIEVWLDGVPDGRIVFWAANDTIYEGLPTNPAIFQP